MDENETNGNNDNPVISIIVPIFNAEQTLNRCVDSILAQTYEKFEVILVNDGSTDKSPILCDQYSKQDNRIIVIHQKNNGLVEARRTGCCVAKGEFVGFVDSDDYLEEEAYRSMYLLSENGTAEMVGCGCVIENTGKIYMDGNAAEPKTYQGNELDKLRGRMMFDSQTGQPAVFQSVACKLFRKKSLMDIMFSMDGRITLGEDAAIVYSFLLKAKKVVLSDRCFYHYVTRNDSMTRSKECSVFEKIYIFQNYMSNYFKRYDEKYKLEMQLNRYLLHLIDMGIENIYGIRHKKILSIQPGERLNGKKVVLYGAGKMGRECYCHILQNGKIELVAWVDKNLAGEQICYRMIQHPQIIRSEDFDYVFIAVQDKRLAMEIQKDLLILYNCTKTIWFPGILRYSGEVDFLNERKLGIVNAENQCHNPHI